MNKLTDEKLDNILATLAAETSLNEADVKEIADSPQLWWAVQRNIAVQKESVTAPWPPVNSRWRWLAFGAVPALALIMIAIGFLALGGSVTDPGLATLAIANGEVPEVLISESVDPARKEAPKENDPASAMQPSRTKIYRVKRAAHGSVGENRRPVTAQKSNRPSEEIKSEFFALTYAGNPESGQLVRVRVPSSMMVNLGLVDSVEKPSRLVDAEVVVGDDGQTHAIRFIRQSAN